MNRSKWLNRPAQCVGDNAPRMHIKTRLLLAALIGCLSTSPALAGLSAEELQQVQQTLRKESIPPWQEAASQVKSLRAHPPDAYAADTWAMLDAETNVSTGKAPLDRATTPKDAKDMLVLQAWLRWRILSENADARYSYAYAADLHYMRSPSGTLHKQAAVFFFHARLALAIDGARCLDQDSWQGVRFGMEGQPYIQPLLTQLSQMPKRDKALAMLEAAAIEEMRGERPLTAGLCTRGLRSMHKAQSAGRQPEPLSSADPQASGAVGKTYSVDVSGLEPDLLAEDLWRKKRREILDTFIKNAAEAL